MLGLRNVRIVVTNDVLEVFGLVSEDFWNLCEFISVKK